MPSFGKRRPRGTASLWGALAAAILAAGAIAGAGARGESESSGEGAREGEGARAAERAEANDGAAAAPEPETVRGDDSEGGAEWAERGSERGSERGGGSGASTGESALIDEIPNARVVSDVLEDGKSVLAAGQPDPEHLEEVAEAGYRSAINLQLPSEEGVEELREEAEALGLDYEIIAIPGADGLSRENAEAFADALEDAEPGVFVHCASSNRVGAMFALKAYYVDGASADEAIERGYEAGMTGLADDVREKL